MHAGWNVMIKLRLDRFLSLCLIHGTMGVIGLAALTILPLPLLASLPYAIASGVIHLGYNLFLARSYATGDLSQVYPIARGSAPLLTLLASALIVGENIGLPAIAGIAILVAGIWFVSLVGRRTVRLDGMTLFYALGTSVFIAAYTIVDGVGARLSGAPLGYAASVFALDACFLIITVLATRGPRVIREVAPYWKTGLAGAALSGSAYAIAIWAMTQAPIASVAALRETGILVVMLLSARVLKEAVTLTRLGGAVLIVAGAVLIRLA